MNLALPLQEELDPGEDEERAEDVDDPVEALEKHGAEDDEDGAHEQGAEDPPEEHPVLEHGRDGEVREDNEEDEEVVDRKRLLDEVAGQELERSLRPEREVDAHVEDQGQRNPDPGPEEDFADADLMHLAVEHAEVDGEQRQDEDGEPEPQRRCSHALQLHARLRFLTNDSVQV